MFLITTSNAAIKKETTIIKTKINKIKLDFFISLLLFINYILKIIKLEFIQKTKTNLITKSSKKLLFDNIDCRLCSALF